MYSKQDTNISHQVNTQEFLVTMTATITLLKGSLPQRSAREYLASAGYVSTSFFGLLYLGGMLGYYLTFGNNKKSDLDDSSSNSYPPSSAKENLEKIYNSAIMSDSHPKKWSFYCFKRGENLPSLNYVKFPQESYVEVTPEHLDYTCKDVAGELNCETPTDYPLCRQIQLQYCNQDELNILLSIANQLDGLGALPMAMPGLALTVLGINGLFQTEKNRARLSNALLDDEQKASIKKIGTALKMKINDNTNVNDIISAFEQYIAEHSANEQKKMK